MGRDQGSPKGFRKSLGKALNVEFEQESAFDVQSGMSLSFSGPAHPDRFVCSTQEVGGQIYWDGPFTINEIPPERLNANR